MSRPMRIAIVSVVALAVLAAVLTRDTSSGRGESVQPEPLEAAVEPPGEPEDDGAAGADEPEQTTQSGETQESQGQLPRFVEVGAENCVPCKMMQPVLDELRRDYDGVLEVEFADVQRNPDLITKYEVRTIPTQVIYDGAGREVFRHVGYWPKEDIDSKLKELGIVD